MTLTALEFKGFLKQLEAMAGSVYFVKSVTADIDILIRKIQKSQALAVELSSEWPLSHSTSDLLGRSFVLIRQLRAPFAVDLLDSQVYEILCAPSEITWLQKALRGTRAFVFVTFLDFPEHKVGLLHQFRDIGVNFYFEFSHYSAGSITALSASEIRQVIRQCGKVGVEVAPPPGRPIWDETIPQTLELEPLVPLAFRFGNSEAVRFSVVIPTFNSKHYLLNVLRHFARQNYPEDMFEIIVIDDGSSDGSQSYIQSYFERNHEIKNLKYIYWSRPQVRTRGDSYFRAGLSRNLGVYHASGELISFIDSDMLVPKSFLTQVERELASYDVVQNVRYHVRPELSTEHLQFEQVRFGTDTFIEEEDYWGKFFAMDDWGSLEAHWKYTCTYSLSMRKELFQSIGRFRRNFVSYGFEDTDLGFRLAKAGKTFHLSKTVVLHLTPEKSQSEYRHSQIQRHILLSRTAKKFFLNNLDPYIYDHLRVYMAGEHPRLRRFFRWLRSLVIFPKNQFK